MASHAEVNKLVELSKKQYGQLKRLSFDEYSVDGEIKDLWNRYRDEYSTKMMNNMGIDELEQYGNGSSLPMDQLKDHGFTMVHQLLNKNAVYFKGIPGIGEVRSQHVLDARQRLIVSLLDDRSMVIEKSELSLKLLHKLYLKQHYVRNKAEIRAFELMHERQLKRLKQLIVISSKKINPVTWVFQQNKAKVERAVEALERFDVPAIYEEYRRLDKAPKIDDVFMDFQKFSADYYGALTGVIGVRFDTSGTFMSDSLVESVENLAINTNGLKGTPRAYQYFAAQFMIHQRKTLIGDDMGLGKTIEAITAMNHLHQEYGHKMFIVVAPYAVTHNWRREIEKWTDLKAHEYHGKNFREAQLSDWLRLGGVLVTNHAHAIHLARSRIGQIDMLIVDEAHYVKNPEAHRSIAVSALVKRARLVSYMTGTPLENNVDEMIQLVRNLQPELIQELRLNNGSTATVSKQFKETISPVYLRRKREDVLSELPELQEIIMNTAFSDSEFEIYIDQLEKGSIHGLRQAAWHGSLKPVKGGYNLRKLSEAKKHSPKLSALLEIVREAKVDGRKVIVFSFYRKVLQIIDKALGDDSYGQLHGGIKQEDRQGILDGFADAKAGSVLVSQIDVGGVGLNIQSASVVIFAEPQYKPSAEKQAIGRVHRMGQTRDVLIYRLITEFSVDERVLEIMHGKLDIFNNFAEDSDLAEQSKLAKNPASANTIKQIIELERRRFLYTKPARIK